MTLALAACGGGGGGNGGGGGGGGGGGTNGAPTVGTTSFTVDQDTELNGKITASDPENDALTLTKTSDPANGTIVSFGTNGQFVYRPKAKYRGADSFNISIADATHTVTATISITVAAVNHAPVIVSDIFTIPASAPVVDVLQNDSDPDGDALTVSIVDAPTTGTAAVVNGKVQLTLPAGFRGFTRFKYHAQDAGGLGGDAIAAVFVDTQQVRLVYQTNDGVDAQNLFTDDLTGRKPVTNFTSTSGSSLGLSNVSANGRTIVWESRSNGATTSIWTAPANLSSAARQISPTTLGAGDTVAVRSPISADGQYVVYGVTSGGTETLYLANLLPGGGSVAIPVPTGALRIESTTQSILFGPSSNYVYFTATSSVGGGEGQATYRIPVSNPAAAVPISTAAVKDRKAAIRAISSDDSRIVELLVDSAPVIERVDFSAGAASAPITLSHAMAGTDTVVDLKADNTLARIAYVVRTGPQAFDLYFADVNTPATGVRVDDIPSDADTPPPTIDAVRTTGDSALLHTLAQASAGPPPTFTEYLFEAPLMPSGAGTVIQQRPKGFNLYTYVDSFNSVAFTSDAGVKVAPRSSLNAPVVVLSGSAVFFEFSADSQLVAGITNTGALALASRGGGQIPLVAGGSSSSQALSVRVVPAN